LADDSDTMKSTHFQLAFFGFDAHRSGAIGWANAKSVLCSLRMRPVIRVEIAYRYACVTSATGSGVRPVKCSWQDATHHCASTTAPSWRLSLLPPQRFTSPDPLHSILNSNAMRRHPYGLYLAARICFYETLRSPHVFFMCSALCSLQTAHAGCGQSRNVGMLRKWGFVITAS
jgi:hypothetical protein